MNRKQWGAAGEAKAAEFLKEKGYRLLCSNFRCPCGEVDLIAQHGDTLVFVEVKARKSAAYGRPAEAVTPMKLQKIQRTAEWYLSGKRWLERDSRIDVIELWQSGGDWVVNHLENVTG